MARRKVNGFGVNAQLPTVSVIIPTLNEARSINACLDSLKNQTVKPLEIIIADSRSKDGTDKIAREYGKVIYAERRGPGPARNAAVKEAKGDIVAFTDADTILPKGWVERISKNFALNSRLIGIGGIQEPIDGNLIEDLHFLLQLNVLIRISGFFRMPGLSTANCAYRRDEFLKLGGFDESLSMFEDGELSWRARKAGKRSIDRKLIVKTSPRRIRQQGFWKLKVKYWKAYLNLIMKKPVTEGYFGEIEH